LLRPQNVQWCLEFRTLLKVLVVNGGREPVKILRQSGGSGSLVTPCDTRERTARVAVNEGSQPGWETVICLACENVVDQVAERLGVSFPHLSVYARATEQYCHLGHRCLDPAGQRKTRQRLVERAAEANHIG
jgi:hypothetical protein